MWIKGLMEFVSLGSVRHGLWRRPRAESSRSRIGKLDLPFSHCEGRPCCGTPPPGLPKGCCISNPSWRPPAGSLFRASVALGATEGLTEMSHRKMLTVVRHSEGCVGWGAYKWRIYNTLPAHILAQPHHPNP